MNYLRKLLLLGAGLAILTVLSGTSATQVRAQRVPGGGWESAPGLERDGDAVLLDGPGEIIQTSDAFLHFAVSPSSGSPQMVGQAVDMQFNVVVSSPYDVDSTLYVGVSYAGAGPWDPIVCGRAFIPGKSDAVRNISISLPSEKAGTTDYVVWATLENVSFSLCPLQSGVRHMESYTINWTDDAGGGEPPKPQCLDGLEPNDGVATAVIIAPGQIQGQRFCPGDTDYFKVSGGVLGTYLFQVSSISIKAKVSLLNESGNTITDIEGKLIERPYGDFIWNPADSALSGRVVWTPKSWQTYYLKVEPESTPPAEGVDYTVQLKTVGEYVVPDEQSTWMPSSVTSLQVRGNKAELILSQRFQWSDSQMENFKASQAYFQYEITRLKRDYLDYQWNYITNLPEATDCWSEESSGTGENGCGLGLAGNEEFEVKSMDWEALQANRGYYVAANFTWKGDDAYYRFQTEAERCGPFVIEVTCSSFRWGVLLTGWLRP